MKKIIIAIALTAPLLFNAATAQNNMPTDMHATAEHRMSDMKPTVDKTPLQKNRKERKNKRHSAPSPEERAQLHAKKQACKTQVDPSKHGRERKAALNICMAH